jgi:hypothetical protein
MRLIHSKIYPSRNLEILVLDGQCALCGKNVVFEEAKFEKDVYCFGVCCGFLYRLLDIDDSIKVEVRAVAQEGC